MRYPLKAVLVCFALASSAAAKNGDPEPLIDNGDPVAERGPQPLIVNGDPVADAANSGFVMVLTPNAGLCSGSLLANDWAVTAAHCQVDTTQPENNIIRMGNLGSADMQQTTADFAVSHPSLDFVLLHLKRALRINGSTSDYRLALYPDSSFSLIGRQQLFYGYSCGQDSPTCTGSEVLRTASVLGAGPFDEFNHGGFNSTGQYPVGGDSGGGLVFENASARALTGILKCGLNCTAKPETFREWFLARLFDRPVPLPKVWFLPFSAHPYLGAEPLENSFSNQATFNPCPGSASYGWTASYNLQQNQDFVTISTQSGASVLTGTASRQPDKAP